MERRWRRPLRASWKPLPPCPQPAAIDPATKAGLDQADADFNQVVVRERVVVRRRPRPYRRPVVVRRTVIRRPRRVVVRRRVIVR